MSNGRIRNVTKFFVIFAIAYIVMRFVLPKLGIGGG
ncbi:MAG: hypothetical protein ACI9UK_002312 [Candidatus Krumholzibacteriia bacterium]|jgi:hypothetical protein